MGDPSQTWSLVTVQCLNCSVSDSMLQLSPIMGWSRSLFTRSQHGQCNIMDPVSQCITGIKSTIDIDFTLIRER